MHIDHYIKDILGQPVPANTFLGYLPSYTSVLRNDLKEAYQEKYTCLLLPF